MSLQFLKLNKILPKLHENELTMTWFQTLKTETISVVITKVRL